MADLANPVRIEPLFNGNENLSHPYYTQELVPNDFGVAYAFAPVDVSQVRLSAAESSPAKEVIVLGVPTTIGKVRVRIENVKTGRTNWGYIRRVNRSSIALVAPVSEIGIGTSCDYEITVFVRSISSKSMTLHVSGLPASPGSTVQMISRLKVLATGGWLAYPIPELQIISKLIDDPANPNSLKAIIDGKAPVLQGEKIDVDLLDRLIANTNVSAAIDRIANEHRMAVGFTARRHTMSGDSVYQTSLTSDELAAKMNQWTALHSFQHEWIQGPAQLFGAISAALAFAGPGGIATSIVLQVCAIVQAAALNIATGVLPSKLSDLRINFALPEPFYVGSLGRVRFAKVYAHSSGYSFNVNDALGVISLFIPAPSALSRRILLVVAGIINTGLGFKSDASIVSVEGHTWDVDVSNRIAIAATDNQNTIINGLSFAGAKKGFFDFRFFTRICGGKDLSQQYSFSIIKPPGGDIAPIVETGTYMKSIDESGVTIQLFYRGGVPGYHFVNMVDSNGKVMGTSYVDGNTWISGGPFPGAATISAYLVYDGDPPSPLSSEVKVPIFSKKKPGSR